MADDVGGGHCTQVAHKVIGASWKFGRLAVEFTDLGESVSQPLRLRDEMLRRTSAGRSRKMRGYSGK